MVSKVTKKSAKVVKKVVKPSPKKKAVIKKPVKKVTKSEQEALMLEHADLWHNQSEQDHFVDYGDLGEYDNKKSFWSKVKSFFFG